MSELHQEALSQAHVAIAVLETKVEAQAKEIEKQWKEYGSHKNDTDPKLDQAIISVDNRTKFADVVAVIDAIYYPKRTFKGKDVNSFNVTFSAR